jgi:hypothetical protein
VPGERDEGEGTKDEGIPAEPTLGPVSAGTRNQLANDWEPVAVVAALPGWQEIYLLPNGKDEDKD